MTYARQVLDALPLVTAAWEDPRHATLRQSGSIAARGQFFAFFQVQALLVVVLAAPMLIFEWLVWVAYAPYALGSPGGAIALSAPAIILYLLFRVTGIPATEAQALRSRGDAYRRYQQTTSVFVPWPPRRVSS